MKSRFGNLAFVAVSAGILIFLASDSLAKNPVRPFHLSGAGTDIALAPECDGGDLINETANATLVRAIRN